MLPFVLSLDDQRAADSRMAGAYAAGLAAARQSGAAVAPGFVVPTHVYHTAPHGEVTPDVEAAIAAAYAALGADAAVILAASAAHPGAPAGAPGQREGAPLATYGPLRGLGQIVRHVEKCWQAALVSQAPAEAIEIAVLIQRA